MSRTRSVLFFVALVAVLLGPGAAAQTGTYTLQLNDTIEISGSVVLYGATTDNTTNDASIQFARVVFALL